AAGREVYGGGGIMPDIFVPTDTANINSYVNQVFNAGLLHRFSFEYADRHRQLFDNAESADEVIAMLPSDGSLLGDFVQFAAKNGVPARWYYINNSRPLLVNQLKALIARDALGTAAYYEIANTRDKVVLRAIESLNNK
ncbi:MAG: peptidase S41, partial [Muribaculaceae bacterium]|nr:peptidase S41 [Muribaculaceae bacterium]